MIKVKIYVLIARHLGQISGEKIYHYNKLKYMVSQGWRVIFLSGKKEVTPVDGQENYSHYVFPALVYSLECYSRREIEKTANSIVKVIDIKPGDKCIIESDSVNRATWAELISSRIGATHLAFLLQENHYYDETVRKFLKFKYDRHELAGITVQSINQMLRDDSVERRADTKISAFCHNVVEDCEDHFSEQLSKNAKYTFGSIGRLDKSCVLKILKGFKDYAARYPNDSFNLILIGGATGEKRIQQIREELKDVKNIQLVITGYLYPIPEQLLNNIDIFVSTAGAVDASYRYHRPTVQVHPITGEPVGILGLDDLQEKTMYDVMENTSVEQCIARALKNSDSIEYLYDKYEDYYQKMDEEFARQLTFAEISERKEYYDESLLIKVRTTHIKGFLIHKIIGHVAGPSALNRFISICKRLRKEGK